MTSYRESANFFVDILRRNHQLPVLQSCNNVQKEIAAFQKQLPSKLPPQTNDEDESTKYLFLYACFPNSGHNYQ